jgi:hypothetical protein
MARRGVKKINLALQGGGALGPMTQPTDRRAS